MSSIELLFTYGTLRLGADNPMQNFLSVRAHWLGQASFQGKLYYCNGHPAVLPSNHSKDKVIGDLFEVDESTDILKILDRYEGFDPANEEGSLYLRKSKRVSLDKGDKKERLEAWIYIFNRPIDTAVRINSGDYLQYSKSNLR